MKILEAIGFVVFVLVFGRLALRVFRVDGRSEGWRKIREERRAWRRGRRPDDRMGV